MTVTTKENRQGIMGQLVNDTRKSVRPPQKRIQHGVVPQNGVIVASVWKIGADSDNIILYRKRASKTAGKESWGVHGYFSQLGHALREIVRQGVRDTELVSLQAVVDKIDALESELLKLAAGR